MLKKSTERKTKGGGKGFRGGHGGGQMVQQQRPMQPHQGGYVNYGYQHQQFGPRGPPPQQFGKKTIFKPVFSTLRSKKFATKHPSWIAHYQKIQNSVKCSNTMVNKLELQDMIADSIKMAKEKKLFDIPYNFNLPSFSFSTVSRSEGRLQRSSSIQTTHAAEGQETQELGVVADPVVSIDPFNLSSTLHKVNSTFQAGSLKAKLPIWRKITKDPEILKLISGVALSFSATPTQDKIPHEIQFSGNQKILVKKELQKFMSQGIIEHAEPRQGDFVSNLFARPKKTPGDIRLILNLKFLNTFVPTTHFKMETLEVALKLLRPNMFMASIDLTNSFYHLLVRPQDRKFLNFYHDKHYLRFTSLVMGFKDSPRLFTKLMKVPLSFLRLHYGCILVCYIDDILILGPTRAKVALSVAHTANLLQMLGFYINFEKSELEPTQSIEFLGFLLDSVNMSVTLTQAKIEKISALASDILKKPKFSIRSLAQFLGNCVAAFPAVEFGPYHTKELEIEKVQALNNHEWDFEAHMSLSQWTTLHVQWWKDNIATSVFSLVAPPNRKQIHLFTDASNAGWGVYFPSTKSKSGGLWDPREQTFHINLKEICAVWFGVQIYYKNLQNCTVHIHTDNQVALYGLHQQGSTRSLLCNKYIAKIMQFLEERQLHLVVSYVRSELNCEADRASRLYEHDLEWSIPSEIFTKICKKWGTPQIDLFASRINHRVPRYCSWKPDPYAYAIDAFALDWDEFDLIYIFAPFSLITSVLKTFMEQDPQHAADAIFVYPRWTAQPWWPVVQQLQTQPPMEISSQDLVLHHAPLQQHNLKFRLLINKLSVKNLK